MSVQPSSIQRFVMSFHHDYVAETAFLCAAVERSVALTYHNHSPRPNTNLSLSYAIVALVGDRVY